MPIKVLIVDDAPVARDYLSDILNKVCPGINILGMVDSAKKAREILLLEKPDILFLDIVMPLENGFEFVESLEETDFKIVFVTAYSEYALKAIKAGAFDYLLKPYDQNEVKAVIEKFYFDRTRQEKNEGTKTVLNEIDKLKFLVNNLSNGVLNKIIISHAKGYKVVDVNSIVLIEGNGDYTNVYLYSQDVILCTKTIKQFEEMLDDKWFVRVHKSYLINLSHLREYKGAEGGYVVLSNGKEISVARPRAAYLHKRWEMVQQQSK